MGRFFRNNGLSLVLFVMFFFTLIVGQSIVGQREYNNERQEQGSPESKPVDAPHEQTGNE